MGRPVLKVVGYSADDIAKLIGNDDRYTIGIRLYAVHQVALGRSSRKLEELYHTSFKQITNWVHRFEQEGVEGLRDREHPGRPHLLTEPQLDRLRELINTELPSTHGYNSATWTGPMLREWIKANFNIDYKRSSIYPVLKDIGFSYQKAKGVYPEADPEKQEEFKEALKKTSRKP